MSDALPTATRVSDPGIRALYRLENRWQAWLDVEAALARAVAAGARAETEIQTHNWGKIATLSDPFGHGFCLVQFLGRGYDEIAEGASG